MSIQSQINRINAAVNTQANKIAQIKTALEGKAAGGGGGASIETCTVTITPLGWDEGFECIMFVTATTFENGSYSSCVESFPRYSSQSKEPVTINNIVCGTVITVGLELYSWCSAYLEIDGTAQVISNNYLYPESSYSDGRCLLVLKAPTVAGENAVIGFSYEP